MLHKAIHGTQKRNIIIKLTVQLHVILKIEMILDTHDILSPKKFDRDRSYLSR